MRLRAQIKKPLRYRDGVWENLSDSDFEQIEPIPSATYFGISSFRESVVRTSSPPHPQHPQSISISPSLSSTFDEVNAGVNRRGLALSKMPNIRYVGKHNANASGAERKINATKGATKTVLKSVPKKRGRPTLDVGRETTPQQQPVKPAKVAKLPGKPNSIPIGRLAAFPTFVFGKKEAGERRLPRIVRLVEERTGGQTVKWKDSVARVEQPYRETRFSVGMSDEEQEAYIDAQRDMADSDDGEEAENISFRSLYPSLRAKIIQKMQKEGKDHYISGYYAVRCLLGISEDELRDIMVENAALWDDVPTHLVKKRQRTGKIVDPNDPPISGVRRALNFMRQERLPLCFLGKYESWIEEHGDDEVDEADGGVDEKDEDATTTSVHAQYGLEQVNGTISRQDSLIIPQVSRTSGEPTSMDTLSRRGQNGITQASPQLSLRGGLGGSLRTESASGYYDLTSIEIAQPITTSQPIPTRPTHLPALPTSKPSSKEITSAYDKSMSEYYKLKTAVDSHNARLKHVGLPPPGTAQHELLMSNYGHNGNYMGEGSSSGRTTPSEWTKDNLRPGMNRIVVRNVNVGKLHDPVVKLGSSEGQPAAFLDTASPMGVHPMLSAEQARQRAIIDGLGDSLANSNGETSSGSECKKYRRSRDNGDAQTELGGSQRLGQSPERVGTASLSSSSSLQEQRRMQLQIQHGAPPNNIQGPQQIQLPIQSTMLSPPTGTFGLHQTQNPSQSPPHRSQGPQTQTNSIPTQSSPHRNQLPQSHPLHEILPQQIQYSNFQPPQLNEMPPRTPIAGLSRSMSQDHNQPYPNFSPGQNLQVRFPASLQNPHLSHLCHQIQDYHAPGPGLPMNPPHRRLSQSNIPIRQHSHELLYSPNLGQVQPHKQMLRHSSLSPQRVTNSLHKPQTPHRPTQGYGQHPTQNQNQHPSSFSPQFIPSAPAVVSPYSSPSLRVTDPLLLLHDDDAQAAASMRAARVIQIQTLTNQLPGAQSSQWGNTVRQIGIHNPSGSQNTNVSLYDDYTHLYQSSNVNFFEHYKHKLSQLFKNHYIPDQRDNLQMYTPVSPQVQYQNQNPTFGNPYANPTQQVEHKVQNCAPTLCEFPYPVPIYGPYQPSIGIGICVGASLSPPPSGGDRESPATSANRMVQQTPRRVSADDPYRTGALAVLFPTALSPNVHPHNQKQLPPNHSCHHRTPSTLSNGNSDFTTLLPPPALPADAKIDPTRHDLVFTREAATYNARLKEDMVVKGAVSNAMCNARASLGREANANMAKEADISREANLAGGSRDYSTSAADADKMLSVVMETADTGVGAGAGSPVRDRAELDHLVQARARKMASASEVRGSQSAFLESSSSQDTIPAPCSPAPAQPAPAPAEATSSSDVKNTPGTKYTGEGLAAKPAPKRKRRSPSLEKTIEKEKDEVVCGASATTPTPTPVVDDAEQNKKKNRTRTVQVVLPTTEITSEKKSTPALAPTPKKGSPRARATTTAAAAAATMSASMKVTPAPAVKMGRERGVKKGAGGGDGGCAQV
ncbi:hypothetical protein K432DRAFT_403859 [Lepidopterella palustris CBS 459.81]|uniref:Uncharacterized protein n=1 Tax=Lepidopterella palustris CBS 459.81 TaxID=1314670 RepID=A0A8E2JGQ8_9PEZI|nr:hypothetical protein K432DRAFT_403859 [Lepidopterella palustris CBS 459.81]